MKKRYGGLALAILLMVGSTLTVHAEDYEGKAGWKAEFTGNAIDSNFTSQSFADEIKFLQPGDSIVIRVAVKNGSQSDTDWYMSNEVLQSLEDSSPAKGGAYTYELTWKGTGDPATLYNSESVGGEKNNADRQGLHEVTDNLEQFFYLDHLAKGEEGIITLKVALNGETQGNNYQNTLARLQLNFAVEGSAGDDGGGGRHIVREIQKYIQGEDRSVILDEATPKAITYSPGVVRTGDTSRLMFWSVMALVSGLGLLICTVFFQKKRRGGNECE
jgi:hypothetical protein